MGIEVYSDGSATVAQKPGGYGWVIVVDGEMHSEGSGHMLLASNNDAELEAALQGLIAAYKFINKPTEVLGNFEVSEIVPPTVTLVSDSQLILGWVSGQFKFKQAEKMDKFNQINALVRRMNVQTRWVRGHSGDKWNERCDELANAARTQLGFRAVSKADLGDTKIGNKKTSVVAIWYGETLKIVDFEHNLMEDYDRQLHGARASLLEIRRDKNRSSK